MKRTFWLLAASLTVCSTSWAVDVQPARLEQTIPAGEPSTLTLEITNPREKAVTVRIQTGPYRFLKPGMKLPSAESWLSFDPSSFTLAPAAQSTVNITVTPPPGVARDTAGLYLAAILVDELPTQLGEPEEKPQAKISIIPRLALPVYLMIEERKQMKMAISSVSADMQQEYTNFETGEESPKLLWLKTTLENQGTVHIRPSGTVSIFDAEGEILLVRPLGKSIPILPQATLTIPTVLKLPEPGFYRVIVTLETEAVELQQKSFTFEVTEFDEVLEKPLP